MFNLCKLIGSKVVNGIGIATRTGFALRERLRSAFEDVAARLRGKDRSKAVALTPSQLVGELLEVSLRTDS